MAKKTPATKRAAKTRNVFVRTVTYFYTGEVVEETRDHITLRLAAWIADTGRFSQAMASGEFSEVEPYPDAMIVRLERGAVVDICDWPHPLPRAQK